MSEVTIYGASDDLIEVEGDAKGCDEYPATDDMAAFVLVGGEARTRIVVRYTDDGVWAVSVAPHDEGTLMHFVEVGENANGYSAEARVRGVDAVIREA